MSKFTLMNKNKKIFDFEYNDEEHIIVKFERNYPDNEDYAPFGLIKDDNIDKSGFNKWWKNRQIPASRNGLKEVLYKSDIYDKDNFDLLDAKAYCLSLSDQYWVKRINEDILWEDISKDAVIVDPGMINDEERLAIDKFIKSNSLKIKHMINTHMHIDHSFGVKYIKDKYGVMLMGNMEDYFLAERLKQQANMFGLPVSFVEGLGV